MPPCSWATTTRPGTTTAWCSPGRGSAAPSCRCSTRCTGCASASCSPGTGWGCAARADEAHALASSIGQQALTAPPLAWLALLAAFQDRDDYDDLLRQLDDVVGRYPLGILADPVHDLTRWARSTRAAATGDSAGALHHLGRIRLPVIARMAGLARIDAAVRAGEPDLVRAWVDELAGFAESTGRAWALATLAHGRR